MGKQTTAAVEKAPAGSTQLQQQPHWRLSPRSRAEAAITTSAIGQQPVSLLPQTSKVQAAHAKPKKVPPWAKDPTLWQAQQQERQRQKLAKAQAAAADASMHQPAAEGIPPHQPSIHPHPHPTPPIQGQQTGEEEEDAQAQNPVQQRQAQMQTSAQQSQAQQYMGRSAQGTGADAEPSQESSTVQATL